MREYQTHMERALLSFAHNGSDYLIAMGVAAMRHNPGTLPLLRMHLAGNQADLNDAFACVMGITRRLSERTRWRLHLRDLQTVAWVALSHHVVPVCGHCHGLRFLKAAEADTLLPIACPHCGGSGRRPVQKHLRWMIERVLVEMEVIEARTEVAINRIVS